MLRFGRGRRAVGGEGGERGSRGGGEASGQEAGDRSIEAIVDQKAIELEMRNMISKVEPWTILRERFQPIRVSYKP